jgi:hypothetical protein
MLFARKRVRIVSAPRLGILDLCGEEAEAMIQSDATILKPLFADMQKVDLSAPTCDVLFLYAKIKDDGALVGASRSLREIIRDSGAKLVVVASPNSSRSYIKAGRQQTYGRTNLVMTLDRRGDSFGRFFGALFEKMKRGTSMPVAWIEVNSQVQGQSDSPETIFACEIGQLAFS